MTRFIEQTRFGAYRDLELIGRGGMAEVYRAEHPRLRRTVAIKLLPPLRAAAAEHRQRFLREARIVSELDHPNIVRVLEYGEEGGMHYIVMEYLGGRDLSRHLQHAGRLSLAQALPILEDVAAALDYAHARGMVHRDVKPSNVMLRAVDEGTGASGFPGSAQPSQAVLMDFGVAKMVGEDTLLTGLGVMMGTLNYIAPEQIQATAEVDGRADVYALGVMAYQMLAGDLPFKKQNPGALLLAHLTQPPPDARERALDLSEKASAALQRAMAKMPAGRFSTAGEFIAMLRS
jgi:serine/threonine protein kinase